MVDMTIANLSAYQLTGSPEQTSVCTIYWGGLFLLEVLVLNAPDPAPIVSRLRSAGVDAFRFVLDNPLALFDELGMHTSVNAINIAAAVRPPSSAKLASFMCANPIRSADLLTC